MEIKERLMQYLDNKGMSPTKAEQLLGWGKGALIKAKSISVDKAGEFLLLFGDLSAEWLLRGEGEMLKSSSTSVATTVDVSKYMDEIEALKIKVAKLEGQNELLREQNGMPERKKAKTA